MKFIFNCYKNICRYGFDFICTYLSEIKAIRFMSPVIIYLASGNFPTFIITY